MYRDTTPRPSTAPNWNEEHCTCDEICPRCGKKKRVTYKPYIWC